MNDKIYPIDLQFFSAEDEGKTEKATPKKREDARKKGQVAKSAELNTAVLLLTFFAAMSVLGTYYMRLLTLQIEVFFKKIPQALEYNEANSFFNIIRDGLIQIILINGPLWIILFTMALVISFLQVGYKVTFEPMRPKFSKMNPIQGLKKIVSKDMIVELIKSLGKVVFLGAIFLNIIGKEISTLFKLYDMSTFQILNNIGTMVMKIGFFVGGAFLFLAVFDYMYQKYKFEDGIKMSKQDIKDEHKQAEGDPQVKGKIKQKMREMSMKRMMSEIKNADVVITNPTHFAVVLRYDKASGTAPVVVAKGVDHLAAKIREKAKEENVQIVENKALARALYYTVDLNQAIPEEFYNAVAEVLAFVYNLENNK